ncbi:MAG TPA: hypothetical protein VLC79_11860 [Cellvibrio sp.]|nr:hypothetical protein [Cellvibrio sp.]
MNNQKTATPLWEKCVGTLGLLLLCTGFVYLTWAEMTAQKSPLHIIFNVEKIVPVDKQFAVIVEVGNTSLQSAAALQVEAILLQDGKEMETNTAQIDYIPSNSTRTIGFFFEQDPGLGKLEFRALAYQQP